MLAPYVWSVSAFAQEVQETLTPFPKMGLHGELHTPPSSLRRGVESRKWVEKRMRSET